jgi:fucose permease
MPPVPPDRARAARLNGYATFLLIGWSGLLVPSLVRTLERDLDQNDAGIGVFYFLYATSYAVGSFVGGLVTERTGRRPVLAASAALHGLGLLALGVAPGWSLFLLAAVPAGLGAGSLDGGTNGLFLDLFATARGRALNNLHLFFGLGALAAPIAIGVLSEAGVAWQAIIAGTGLAAVPVAVTFAVAEMPSGRRAAPRLAPLPEAAHAAGSSSATAAPRPVARPGRGTSVLLLLGVAIATYVAGEIGISNWLVRYLESAPLLVATASLSLFWGGLALGRLVSARIADRFDHARFTAAAAGLSGLALLGAILVPWLPLRIALFTLTGFASGPIFPMIVAIGGERFPTRAAAISGTLVSFAVVGSIVYPPVMGFISVSVGLTAAMLGLVLMYGGCLASVAVVAYIGARRAT